MSNDITDGVYGYVSGTVTRSFDTKNGKAYEVEVKAPNQQYGDKWTIWADLAVPEGTRVTVKGWLSAKAETYEKDGVTKAACRRAVNKAQLEKHELAAAPVQDAWAGGGSYGDDTPF